MLHLELWAASHGFWTVLLLAVISFLAAWLTARPRWGKK